MKEKIQKDLIDILIKKTDPLKILFIESESNEFAGVRADLVSMEDILGVLKKSINPDELNHTKMKDEKVTKKLLSLSKMYLYEEYNRLMEMEIGEVHMINREFIIEITNELDKIHLLLEIACESIIGEENE